MRWLTRWNFATSYLAKFPDCRARDCPLYRAQAPVAQLDRALPSEGRGLAFESRRVHQ